MISSDTQAVLNQYVRGEISNSEIADWLSGAEYDDSLQTDERDILASIRLIVVEVKEGERNPEEIVSMVAEALALAEQNIVYADRSGSSTLRQEESEFSSSPSRVQRVGISP